MAIGTLGLKTHIWNNQLRSVVLLALFPALIFFIAWGFMLAFNPAPQAQLGGQPFGVFAIDAFHKTVNHLPYIIAGVVIWYAIAFMSHERLIRASTKAVGVTRKEEPKLYNMLENMCISRGIPMPKLAVIDSPVLNAYASGINHATYTITLTRGIIDRLEDDEIEAVIAHELSHVINQDVRMMIIAVIFVGIISFLAEMLFRGMLRGSRGNSRGGGKAVLIAFVIMAVAYVLAILIRFAISRKREYLADAGAVELTKNPDAMLRALQKISGNDQLERMPDEVMQMCISFPKSAFSLFSTHPPMEKRLDALRQFAGANTPTPSPWG